jgi:flagellin-specific chaperone FliS
MPQGELIPDNDPLMGSIEANGFVSTTPPDVQEFLQETGLVDKSYVCTLKRAPQGGSASKEFLPGSTKGTYPPIEEVGRRFGPGRYYYIFTWRQRDPETGKPKSMLKEYPVYLGSEWDEVHDEYMSEKWAKREKDIEKMAQRNKMQKAAKGILSSDDERSDPIEDMKKTMSVLKDLGVPIGGKDLPKEADGFTAMFPFLIQMMQKSSESQMQMFMQMNTNMMQMMGLMLQNNQPQSTNDIFKEVMSVVRGAVNLKEALNPEKQGMVERLFGLAESVMPAIMQIAQKPPHVRAQDPLVGMVKGSKDFEKLKSDPEMLRAMVEKWDKAHGKEQTGVILETLGLSRQDAGISTEPDEGEFSDVEPEPMEPDKEETED